MKKFFLLLICIPPLTLCAQPYWQQEVHYQIDVTLNDVDNTLRGNIRMHYINHSPDTLHFIWLHVWPNAFKTDRTAFSDQMLENGRTDFYFSQENQRGYINHLDFTAEGRPLQTEDHPQYIDIIKVILPRPLGPGGEVSFTTSFFEKIPVDFFGSGHKGQSYHLSNWYPQPAVYDQNGWHPMPYLDQGGDYGEFGSYEVRITLPNNYLVASNGQLQDQEEIAWLKRMADAPPKVENRASVPSHSGNRPSHAGSSVGPGKGNKQTAVPASESRTKTILIRQDHISNFSWYADKEWQVSYDSMKLPSGRTVDLFSFYSPGSAAAWRKSIPLAKQALNYRGAFLGEYPFASLNLVEKETDGIAQDCRPVPGWNPILEDPQYNFSLAIEEVVGRKWLDESVGADQRRYRWMSEGLNTYYDARFADSLTAHASGRSGKQMAQDDWLKRKLPEDPAWVLLDMQIREKSDQPIQTNSPDFSQKNYCLIPSVKTALWLKILEDSLGVRLFDSCMRAYFENWQFRHPDPQDFEQFLENTSGKKLDQLFGLLEKTGPLTTVPVKRELRPTFLFSLHQTDRYDYINLGPAVGYNLYDQFMVGVLIHNYNLPPDRFQFVVAPLYATASKQLNGLADLSYRWAPPGYFQQIRTGVAGSRFSSLSGTDSNGHQIFGGFYKIVPSLRLDLRKKTPRSTLNRWISLKSYLIGEKGFNYFFSAVDSQYHPAPQSYAFRYLNQADFNWADDRVLYPWSAQVQVQQASDFYRVNLTGNYFFNYASGGGLQGRIFAAKFGYIGGESTVKTFETSNYQPKLTAVRGSEDYTYSNYFLGRNESSGFASQQMMMRDGGLKLRTDLFQGLQGRSDNWIASLNLNSTLPAELIPRIIPLKIFLDVGTYAEAWGSNPPTSRFLYVGGLQLSLLKGLINIYAPLVYSSDFSSNLKTVPEENSFWKKISFSIDIQGFDVKKIRENLPVR